MAMYHQQKRKQNQAWISFLRNATKSQLDYILIKEKQAGRREYARLVLEEIERRKVQA